MKITKKISILAVGLLAGGVLACGPDTISQALNGQVKHNNQPIAGAHLQIPGMGMHFYSDSLGNFSFIPPEGDFDLVASAPGFINDTLFGLKAKDGSEIKVQFKLAPFLTSISDSVEQVTTVSGGSTVTYEMKTTAVQNDMVLVEEEVMEVAPSMDRVKKMEVRGNGLNQFVTVGYSAPAIMPAPTPINREQYEKPAEVDFKDPFADPLSTFSIDVDKASYANCRRMINQGQRPPVDAVRIEELVNYFQYDYATPKNNDPFAVHTEMVACPWAEGHKVVRIGIKGREIDMADAPNTNLVFLLDVSGSMSAANKLPLVKKSMIMLSEQLRTQDKVSIVVYAGAAGIVLDGSNDTKEIERALNSLNAGGSTAGGAGIELAYATAAKHFIKGGNNRVILCTDGDFNVGVSSDDALVKMIEKKRQEGVFLTVMGFGQYNLQDAKMEKLADKGNGSYYYIDNLLEAQKNLVEEMGGTLFTIAKDVKIQVEFNPAKVQAYRLIGYENRMLAAQDFNDDKKDAGEIGAGHTVTALYEVVPVGVEFHPSVDPLKYQKTEQPDRTKLSDSKEWMTVKLRYKQPDGDRSQLLTHTIEQEQKANIDTQFAMAVAQFGMVLTESSYCHECDLDQVIKLANNARGVDEKGYRAEFVRLVELSKSLL